MRRARLAGWAVATSVVLTACSAPAPSNSDEEAEPGYVAVADDSITSRGDLTIQLDYDSVETDGLDPQTAAAARSWSIESLVYEPLVTIGPDFEIEPLLAESWTQPSPTEYVFTLRDGVTFSNGRELTTADVVGSIERLVASKSPYSTQLGPIASVVASGERDVTVTLEHAYTPFLPALANTPAAILPMTEINDSSVDIKKTMLGTGPFVVQDHRQDESWTFVANDKYRNAADLGIDTLTIEIVPQESTRLAAIRDGSAGLAFFNNVDSLDLLDGTADARVVSQRNSDFYYLIQNSQNPNSALADQEVRFAINSALDRQQIADIALGGQVQPTGVTPAVLPGACDPAALPAEDVSNEDAKAALEKAGAGGLTVSLAVYSDEPALKQIAQVIQQQLAEIGVTVKIDSYDYATYGAKVFGVPADFDMALGWFAGYVDASMVARWWNPVVAGFSATFLADDPELDELIEQASSTPAGSERDGILTDLCEKVDTNAEMLPLVTRPSVIGYRTDKVSPTLYSDEGYGNILRNIVEFKIESSK